MTKEFRLILTVALLSLNFQQVVLAQDQIKSRSPIRTRTASEGCLCPYDQVVKKPSSLSIPREEDVYTCGEVSAWARSGGREPACYLGEPGQSAARAVERECREMGTRFCYVDFLRKYSD